MIASQSGTSAAEIARAQEAMNAKIAAANEAQFGKQTSMIETAKASYVGFAVAAVAAWALVNKAVGMMDEAGKALQIESSFKIMSDAAGVNSEKLIGSMKAATKETVDDSDLMQKAVKLMLLDFNAEQIVDFSNVVVIASQFAGKTVSETFDALGDAIANRTPKALRALGALAPEQMTIFKEAVTAGATSSDILALAVANLELKELQLKGTQSGATIALQQFHAQVSETGETLGKILIVAVQKAYAVFQEIGVMSLETSSSIWKLAAAGAALASTLTFGDISKSFKEMSASFKEAADADFAAAIKLGTQAHENWTGIAEVEGKATTQELEGGKAKVASALTVLGSYKDNTQATKDGAAAAKKAADDIIAAEKSITEEIRKASVEAETIGMSQYDKDVARIESEKAKWIESLGGTKISIQDLAFVQEDTSLKMEAANKKAYEAMAAAARSATDVAISEMEREIGQGVKLSDAHIKGATDYKTMVADEYGFAATENERQINAIIAKEGDKLVKLQVLYDKGYISFGEYETLKGSIHANTAAAILQKETDNVAKIATLNSGLISGIRGWEKQAYDAKLIEIATQAEKQLAAGASWQNVYANILAKVKAADQDMALATGTFFDGVGVGFARMKDNALTFGQAGLQIMQTFADSSKTAISDVLFQSFKTGTFDAQAIWTTFTDSMLRKFTDIIGRMAVEAAANTIDMLFNAAVSGDWSQILGLINKAWDLGNSMDWSFAQGGMVPGYASGGDSKSNDTVRAWLSPGEYVVPRSAINADSLELLEFLRKSGGQARGYSDGGLVKPVDTWTGTLAGLPMPIKPSSYLDPLYVSLNASTNDSGMSSISGWTIWDGQGPRAGKMYGDKQEADWGILSPKWPVGHKDNQETNRRQFYRYDGTTDESELNVGSQMAVWGDIFTALWGVGMAAMTGTAAAWVGGGLYGAAIGAEMGATSGYITSGGNPLAAGLGALAGGIGGYYAPVANPKVSDIFADVMGNSAYADAIAAGGTEAMAEAAYKTAFENYLLQVGIDTALDAAASFGLKGLKKFAIGEVMKDLGGAMGGGKSGSASLSFAGGSGDLSGLADLMGQIAPKESSFSFSAQNGLDYVPRDNFRINAHEGEAVLNKSDAEDWRGGNSEVLFQIAKSVAKTAKILDRFDGDGMPGLRNVG